ncbi:DNA-protecting protein DprA [Candidatus Parcubacteria bacterium]|nr:MAG: DNA-protecting protein DprA [Candidatus Parcubacteria bacterium]
MLFPSRFFDQLSVFPNEFDVEHTVNLNKYAKIIKMSRKIIKPNNYPSLLKQIPDPPKQLYMEGELPSENALYLAVVGARKFTTYGKEACEKIISGLKNKSRQIIIVSGLAIGIDGIAHRAALANGLATVAIPGSGLSDNVLHPRSNVKLSKDIVRAGGCLISELDWEIPAGMHTFPSRNRIIAGMSNAVLVIEAAEKSGTLITANLALEYNRDVLAIPGSIFSENSKGTNRLIKSGATPIFSGEDILEAFDIPKEKENLKLEFPDDSVEEKIYSLLSEPMQRDELIRKTGLPPAKANPALSMMILNGIIKESGGEIFRV